MKFLCLSCNDAMTLQEADRPEAGESISAVFGCPSCGHQVAMLTNAYETQVVDSLGVKIGPEQTESKCPFSNMVSSTAENVPAVAEQDGMPWTAGALARLDNVPEMVRPMAKQGVEQFARGAGHELVTEAVMDKARGQFGM